MKRKIIVGILYILLTVILCGGVLSFAKDSSFEGIPSSENERLEFTKEIINSVVSHNIENASLNNINEYIGKILSEGVGGTADWYVLALSQYGSFDFTKYRQALEKYLEEKDIKSATTRLKFALLLLATGGDEAYIEKCLNDETVGGQGIMSYVYGLHLINNGREGKINRSSIIEQLKNMRHPDNGWSVTGDYGDVDVTAMVLQALAPSYLDGGTLSTVEKENVKDLVENGIAFLSERQLEDGDFQSFGVRNAESTAQVITALSAFGIDAAKDERFIKNNHSALDGLMMYYLKDGSFSHKLNAEANPNATVQSFYSLVAYVRMFDGRGSLFVLDKNEEIPVTDDKKDDTHDKESGNTGTDNSENDKKETEDLEKDIMEAENEEGKNSENEIRIDKTESSSVKGSYKKYVIGGLIILAAIICIILSILKKHIKNHIFVLILTLAGILFVILTDFSSVDTYYSDTGKKDDTFGMVTMSIRCDILNGKNTDEHIPKDGCILDTTEFEISRGDTAYDVLLEAAKKYSISVEHEGSSELAYISGINFLYEHDFGDLSGWVYKVNGELPSVGCAGYVLKDKDVIEWCYTLDLGNDTMK